MLFKTNINVFKELNEVYVLKLNLKLSVCSLVSCV